MNVKYVFTLVTGVVECLFFTGLLFGWASLVFVLKEENYFCSDASPTSKSSATVATPMESRVNTNVSTARASYFSTANRSFVPTTQAMTPDRTIFTAIKDTDDCTVQQSIQLNAVFTVASMLLSFSTFPGGYIYDTRGTWVARTIALILFTIGCILTAVSSPDTAWILYASMSLISVGGILLLITNLQIGNLFGKYRSSVITLMSGSLDSSSFVFLIFKAMHYLGVSLNAMFGVMACSTIFLWLRTFILLPRKKYPFPLPKDYNYSMIKCVRARKTGERELTTKNGVNGEEKVISKMSISADEKSTVPPVTQFIKTSLFWGNALHFAFLQLRTYFYIGMLNDSLSQMNNETIALSSYLTVFGTCQLFGFLCAPMNGILIDGASKTLRKKNVDSDLIPLFAVSYSSATTTLLGIAFSVFVSIPYLSVQYGSFVLQVVFRSFLYGGNLSFIATAFPVQHYGKLYGLTMCIGGVIAFLQFPLMTLVLDIMDSDFTTINIVFVIVSVLSILHPLNIRRVCKRKMAAKKISIDIRVEE